MLWKYEENKFGKNKVLIQTANIVDEGPNDERTYAIIKNPWIHKYGVINYEFRASKEGVVACIFKYKDDRNFLTFEVGGGEDVAKRFFQVRKKFENSWSSIKRYNSIEELSTVPFFGYEPNNWYQVQIQIINAKIRISAALLGSSSMVNIMTVEDNSIPNGRVGFGGSGTEFGFGMISVSPLPLVPSNFFYLFS